MKRAVKSIPVNGIFRVVPFPDARDFAVIVFPVAEEPLVNLASRLFGERAFVDAATEQRKDREDHEPAQQFGNRLHFVLLRTFSISAAMPDLSSLPGCGSVMLSHRLRVRAAGCSHA